MTIQPSGQGVYRIDVLHSRTDFRAKHQFGTGTGTVRGSFGPTGGEIAVAVPREGSTVHASASALSFVSGNRMRDRKVRSKTFLDAADIIISATGKIDRYAHGITAAKGMAGRHLWLTITVRATLQS